MTFRRQKIILAAGVAVALAACGPPLPTPEEGRSPATAVERPEATMQDMVLRLYGSNGEGAPGRPAFWVHAARSTLVEDGVWTFENARAVIYDQHGDETLLEAAHGQVDQREGRQSAFLDKGVSLRAGDLTLQLENLEWANDERTARSDAPLRMVGDGADVTAGGLRYYPDEQRVVLSNVRGTLALKGDDTP